MIASPRTVAPGPGAALALGALVLAAGPAAAVWSSDPFVDNPVCTHPAAQSDIAVCSDGAGGLIAAWVDRREGTSTAYIFAQRLDANGDPVWATDGVRVAEGDGTQFNVDLCPDGAGGAILVWDDQRTTANWRDLYAQRLDADGNRVWADGGALVCDANRPQSEPAILADGAGGAFISWIDNRGAFGTYDDIYAQRIDADGVSQWLANGVPVATTSGSERYPRVVSDGDGGVIVAFWRLGSALRAQRLSGAGAAQWAVDGVAASVAAVNYPPFDLVSDGANGAIMVWEAATSQQVYAQRLAAANGASLWPGDMPVCDAGASATFPTAISDGVGGAYVTWQDNRLGEGSDIYAQRIDGTGAPHWTVDGLLLSDEPTYIPYPRISSDGEGGAVVSWIDTRLGGRSFYAQRLQPDGTEEWTSEGVLVSKHDDGTELHPLYDGVGGTILTFRGDNPGSVYAKRITNQGSLGEILAIGDGGPGPRVLGAAVPNPFRTRTELHVDAHGEAAGRATVFAADGRRVRELRLAGSSHLVWDGRNDAGTPVAPGVYWVALEVGGETVSRRVVRAR